MNISFGNNSKMTALVSDRGRIQIFYRDVLGCNVVIKEDTDVVSFGGSFHTAIKYEDNALEDSQLLKGIWLELRTDDVDGLKKKILEFGLKELNYWDKEHFYFQAPGGQVFRLTGSKEDMSKWRA